MSIYFTKGKGWRYDFTLTGERYTKSGFKTKAAAKKAEAKRKEEITKPQETTEIQTDMVFSDLLNMRLDYVESYKSNVYYTDYLYMVKKWVSEWGYLECKNISTDMIESYLLKRSKISPDTANKDLRYLRAVFNFGIKKQWIINNPSNGIDFFPVEKKIKYVPPVEDVLKVIFAADQDTRDYLITISELLARVSEINRLTWQDVNLEQKYVVLYTRKKKGGHKTPRKVPMTEKLCETLLRRYQKRDKSKAWIFWHRYWSRKEKIWVEGPYDDRKRIMTTLCKRAGVKYFRYHALRHYGASIMDNANVPTGSIQRILGHENRTTTEIYLHSVGESEREAMKVYEQVMLDFQKKSHTFSHTKPKTG